MAQLSWAQLVRRRASAASVDYEPAGPDSAARAGVVGVRKTRDSSCPPTARSSRCLSHPDPPVRRVARRAHRDTGFMPVATAPRSATELTASRIQEIVTLRNRPGHRFLPTVERELDSVMRGLAAKLPGANRGVCVIAEMPGPAGLPDLLAVPVTPQLKTRVNYDCPPLLVWADVRLVAEASVRRPISLKILAKRLESTEPLIRRRLPRLVKMGALLEVSAGQYVRPNELHPVGRLYAIEAKVDDWSAGLGQALRYGSWADASATVLSRLPRDHSRAIAQAIDLGVGLALGPRWLVRPRVRQLAAARRLWASEHVVAALRTV